MRRVTQLLPGLALAGGLGIALASPAAAVDVVACDSYGQTCPAVLGEEFTRGSEGSGGAVSGRSTTGRGSTSPSTLPFTGGDVVLLSVIGAGAVAGGAALIAAGRRRTPATA